MPGIDGDDVFDCPVAGRVEMSSDDGEQIRLRSVVSIDLAAGAP